VGGPVDLQGGPHIFFKCGKGEQTRKGGPGGSTLAGGGPAPVGPPDATGLGEMCFELSLSSKYLIYWWNNL